jgi:predicted nuclease of restriction endonuclease-like (RecB) superfamily
LEFLDLPNEYSEKDLQNALISNIRDFILELGKDFTFVGQNYRLMVGNHDYYLDLLFYHRGFSCLVNIEFKIGEFKPEYLGK